MVEVIEGEKAAKKDMALYKCTCDGGGWGSGAKRIRGGSNIFHP
ncbi:hypothetical protein CsSME_00006174 [Camellia sinensis var. sinensis]